MGNVLVIVEHENGVLKSYSKELLSKGGELAGSLGGAVMSLAFGPAGEGAVKASGVFGVKEGVVVEGEGYANYIGESFSAALFKVVGEVKPQVILASASVLGKDLLPRVSVKLKAGLATDCVELSIADNELKARRPIFAGKALVDVNFKSAIQMATARPNSFPVQEKNSGKEASVKKIKISSPALKIKVKEIKKKEKGSVDLGEAEVVVSGGRAVGNAENFKYIRELADAVGGAVGASRAAVDAGYISHDHQVGQTGKTVNPKLYIVCGISGAIQHLAGMRTSKVIVAINKDKEAPIFSKADYGIVGDIFQVLPVLSKKFRELLGK